MDERAMVPLSAIVYADQMNASVLPGETPVEREARIVEGFVRRLRYILEGFRLMRDIQEGRLGFNESLSVIKKSSGKRRRGKGRQGRFDPELELLVNMKSLDVARARDGKAETFEKRDVHAAVLEIEKEFDPRRGRTPDTVLQHIVHALMALHHQTSGTHLRVNLTRNGEYDPHIVSLMGKVFLAELRKIDPDITLVQFVNIVAAARKSGKIEGKSVEDLMPCIDWKLDPATGQPVSGRGDQRIEFVPLRPIYSS